MKLSVVIPCYNEEDNIARAIFDVKKHFPKSELIIINDASKDKTMSILRFVRKVTKFTIINNKKNLGHGASVIKGLKYAKGDYVLYIDADRQISLDHFVMYKNIPFVSGCRIHRQDKLFRKIISFCLKTTNLFRHGYYIKDANCPFKIYKRKELQIILKEVPKTYIIPIACIEVLARKHGFRTKTILTPHKKYDAVRKGMLQSINRKSLIFFYDAFMEICKI